MSDEGFGDLLHAVECYPYPCPVGHRDESMRVFVRAVVSACGEIRWLPRLTDHSHPNQSGKPKNHGLVSAKDQEGQNQ